MTKYRKTGKPTAPRRTRRLMALEPRMMFDGAAVATAVAGVEAVKDQSVLLASSSAASLFAGDPVPDASMLHAAFQRSDVSRAASETQERPVGDGSIRFLPFSVAAGGIGAAEWTSLASDAEISAGKAFIFVDENAQTDPAQMAEWSRLGRAIVLDGTRDGVEQVLIALAGERNVDALHFIGMPTADGFAIGTTPLDPGLANGTLTSSLAMIGAKLDPQGGIFLYGGGQAGEVDGQRLVDAVASATGVDVAARVDTDKLFHGARWAGQQGPATHLSFEGRFEGGLISRGIALEAFDPDSAISAGSDRFTAGKIIFDGNLASAERPPISRDVEVERQFPVIGDVLIGQAIEVAPAEPHELVFVDGGITDYQALIAEIGSVAEIVILDPGKDGVEQIADILAERRGVTAIHIVSHGDAGRLSLGTAQLSGAAMAGEYADELAVWGAALSGNADILIYGCDFGADGAAAMQLLADATGADVAASTDDTGAARLGGDWDLEVRAGTVEAQNLALPDWNHLLARPALDLGTSTRGLANDAFNNDAAYTENAAAVRIAPVATISDADGDQLNRMEVEIQNPQSGDVLANASLSGTGVSVTSYSNGTRLVFTGNATAAVYQGILRNVTFATASDAPVTGDRQVRVQVRDVSDPDTGLSANRDSYVTVTAVNDAPVLTTAIPIYTAIEDAAAPVNGTAAGALLSTFTGGISDADGGAVTKGVAITATNARGVWWYTMDGGATWQQVGTVSATQSLLLADNGQTRLYFQETTANSNAALTSAFTFRAWDQTTGTAGTKVTTATNGGITAFSATTTTATVNIDPVNDAPVLVDIARTMTAFNEDVNVNPPVGAVGITTQTATLYVNNVTYITEVDTGAVRGIAIVGVNPDHGVLWYSIDNGTTWTQVGSASETNALLLSNAATTRLYFQSSADYNGTISDLMTVRAWDQTQGSNGGRFDIAANGTGGTTAFSAATDAVAQTVNVVADITADTLNGINSAVEDTAKVFNPIAGTGGATADTFEGTNPQITAIAGTAIAPNGTVAVGNGTVTLGADGQTLTFLGATDYAGTTTFSYSVTSGGVTETANISVTVTAVPDAPRIDLDTTTAGFNYSANYDQGKAAIGKLITVTDPEGGNLTSMTITLVGATAADTLTVGGLANLGIAANYNATTGALTLTGTRPLADYQTALNSVQFQTTSSTPGARTITVSALSSTAPNASNIAVATLTAIDSDGDGTANAGDIDDDNDGILDIVEGDGTSLIPDGGFTGSTAPPGWYYGAAPFTSTSSPAYSYNLPNSHLTGGLFEQMNPGGNANVGMFSLVQESEGATPAIYHHFQQPLQAGTYDYTFDLSARLSVATDSFYVTLYNLDTQQVVQVLAQDPINTLPSMNEAGNNYKNFTGSVTVTTPGNYALLFQINPNGAENGDYLIDRVAFGVAADIDNDGILNRLDLDSDNDGITDNIEAQTTAGYKPPSGQGATMIDADNDGLDDRYDANTADISTGASLGLTPVDTDGDATLDFRDTDADADGVADIIERGDGQPNSVSSTTDTDRDGLLDIFEHGTANDGYYVHDGAVTTSGAGLATTLVSYNLADSDNDTNADGSNAAPRTTDLDYRDNQVQEDGGGDVVDFDNDGDFVIDSDDIDDDNDGIIDSLEGYDTTAVIPLTTTNVGTNSIPAVNYNGTTINTVVSHAGSVIAGNSAGEVQFQYTGTPTTVSLTLDFDKFTDLRLSSKDGAGGRLFDTVDRFTVSSPGSIIVVNDPNGELTIMSGVYQDTVSFRSTLADNVDGSWTVTVLGAKSVSISAFNTEPISNPGNQGGTIKLSVVGVSRDTDGDGYRDHEDIDSDNDGITDNVEAQSTAGYLAPSGQGVTMVDADEDGLDDVYDANDADASSAASIGLAPVDTDTDGIRDYLDSDSDGDGVADIVERGDGQATSITSTTDTDKDGLLDIFEGSNVNDGFDPNDQNLTGSIFNLADSDEDTAADGSNAAPRAVDLDYRDNAVSPIVDLDGNNSSGAAGVNYTTSFTTGGSRVAIADADVTITDDGSTIASATITLTDAQAGDQLLVNGSAATSGTLPSGIGWTRTDTLVTLSGVFTKAQYQAALQLVAFANANVSASLAARHVTVTVNDGNSTSAAATTTITLVQGNRPPVADDETNSTNEDIALVVTAANGVLAGDTDADDDALIVTQFVVNGTTYLAGAEASLTQGKLTINGNGSYSFVPATNYNGPVPVATYTVSDGNGGTDSGTLTLTVNPINDAPTWSGVDPNDPYVVGYTEGGAIVEVVSPGLSISDADSTIFTQATVRITNHQAGDTLAVVGSLPSGMSATYDATTGTLTISGNASAANYATALKLVAYSSSSLDPSEVTRTVETLVSDGTVNSAPAHSQINVTAVERTPIVDLNSATTISEQITNGGFAGLTGWTRVGGTGIVATAVQNPANTGFIWQGDDRTATLTQSGIVGWDRGLSKFGTAQLSFDIGWTEYFDPLHTTHQATLEVSVGGVTYARITTSPGNGTVGTIEYFSGAEGNLEFLFAGPFQNWAMTPLVIDLPASVAATGDLVFSFSSAGGGGDDIAIDNVSVRSIVDSDPGLNYAAAFIEGGAAVSISDADAAIFDADDTNIESATIVLTNKQASDLLSVGTLPAGITSNTVETAGAISVTLTGSASKADYATAIHAITFSNSSDTPSTVARSIEVTVTDGTNISLSAMTSIAVAAVNDAPVADDEANSVNEDETLTVTAANGLLTGDTDPDGDLLTVTQFTIAGDATVYTAGSTATVAGVGTLTINANGSYSFTPETNYTGPVPVATYTVGDGALTSTASLTITIVPANDAPAANDDSDTVTEDVTLTVPAGTGLLANDTDIDGDPLTITRFTIAGDATVYTAGSTATVAGVGTLTINANGSYSFGPVADYFGPIPVATYTISDGATTDTATLTLTIAATNDAPVANDDSDTVTEDVTLTVPAGTGLLANDTDIDGDPLTITRFTVAGDATVYAAGSSAVISGMGTLIINANGSYSFTPAANYSGPVPVATYTLDDGTATDTATLTLTINPVDDAPVVDLNSGLTPTQIITNGTLNGPGLDGWTASGSYTLGSPGRAWWSSDPTTLTQTDVAGWNMGSAPSGAAQLTFDLAWDNNEGPPARLEIAVGGVVYAIFDGSAGAGDTDNTAVGTITYLNGATGSPATVLTSVSGTWTPYPVTIDLPADVVPVGGLTFSYTEPNGASGDSFRVDNISAFTLDPAIAPDAAAGIDFATSCTENGAPVSVADTDSDVRDIDDTMVESATIVLTNAKAGDLLSVIGSLPAGINSSIDTSISGQITVSLTGTASEASYAAAIRAIGFSSTSETPSTEARVVEVSVNDGELDSAVATTTISVTAVNDMPVPVGTLPAQSGVDAATIAPIATASGFSDADSDALTYSAAGLPAGLSIDSSTGIISGTLDKSASQGGTGGVHTIVVTASDGSASTTQTFTYTVTNPAPVADNETNSTNEDTTLTVEAVNGVLAGDGDPDGDPLTITQFVVNGTAYAAGAPAMLAQGTLTINADGSYSFVPAANYNGAVPVATYTLSDGNGGTDTGTLTLTVDPVNDDPVGVDESGVVTEDTPLTVPAPSGLLINDYDPDGDPLTVISFVVGVATYDAGDTAPVPGVGSITINADGSYSFTPAPDYTGPVPDFTYQISDGNGGTATGTLSLTITPTPDAPETQGLQDRLRADGESFDYNVAPFFSDPDGDTLNYVVTGLPTGLTFDPATGAISGTIDNQASQGGTDGVYTITVTAYDRPGATGLSTSATFDLTVNNPAPVAVNDSASTLEETLVNIDVLANDTDADADSLTVTSAVAANGTVVIEADGTLSYTPDTDFNGVDTITYTIDDSNGGASTAQVAVTVNAVNDDPTADDIDNQIDSDGQILTGVDAVDFSVHFQDADGDALTYSAINLPTGLSIDPMTGIVSGTIDNSASTDVPGGVYSVTITVDDSNGGMVDQSFAWTISNLPPKGFDDALPGTGSVSEDSGTASVTDVEGLLANDEDDDGDTLTVTGVNGLAVAPGGSTSVTGSNGGTFLVSSDGSYSFTPDASFQDLQAGESRVTTILYVVTDSDGDSDTATLTVVVTGVNDDPTVDALQPVIRADSTSLTADPLDLSDYFDDVEGDTLTFDIDGLPAGLTFDPATGIVTGVIAADASQGGVDGVYTVSVTATDGNGGQTVATFDFTVTNPAPTAGNDTATTAEDTATDISVLGNDSDTDGDTLFVDPTFTPIAAHGTVTINADGTLHYVPDADFNGTDTIVYRVSDGEGGLSTGQVIVTVAAGNDAPVAGDNVGSVNEDVTLNVSAGAGLLSNDTDIDGDPLTVTQFNVGADTTVHAAGDSAVIANVGTLTVNADGSYSFAPLPNYSGPVPAITYTVSDGSATDTATLTITIVPRPDAPVAMDDTNSVVEDVALTVPASTGLLANDSDADGDLLTVSQFTVAGDATVYLAGNAATIAGVGVLTINVDGSYSFAPAADFNGPVPVATYRIADGNGATATATLTLVVAPSSDAPVAIDDGFATDQDTPTSGNLLADNGGGADTDPDGNSLSVIEINGVAFVPGGSIALPSGALLTVNADGTFVYDPNGAYDALPEGQTVSDGFTYTISDGTGQTAQANVQVTVTGLDDPLTITGTGDGPVAGTDGEVLESDLPTGTDAAGTGETFTGSFVQTAGDGFQSVTIRGVPITGTPTPASPIVVAGAYGELHITDIDAATGEVSYTYALTGPANQSGGDITDDFPITIVDKDGDSVAATLAILIRDDAPAAMNDSASVSEDAAVPATGDLLANDLVGADVTATPVSGVRAGGAGAFAAAGVPVTGSYGSLTVNADGTYSYLLDAGSPAVQGLNAGETLNDVFTYEITDADGSTSTATLTLTVAGANDAPVVSTPVMDLGDSDGDTVSFDVSDSFSDPDGDTLEFGATGLPEGLTIDPDTGIVSGQIAADASQGGPAGDGVYTVTITASDGNGGSVSDIFTYTVTNPAPVAANDSANTSEDVPVTIAVLTNDSDSDGDALTISSAVAGNGTVTINADGMLTYMPNANFHGTDTISYIISDGEGGTSTAEVTVTVTPVNDGPVLSTPLLNRTNPDGAAVSIALAGNFADVDGDTLNYSATGLPEGLAINAVTGVVSGTIAGDASQGGPAGGGVYTVIVTVSDGNGETVSDSFVYTVTNPAPVAANDSAITSEDMPVTISVLANDNDPDGDAIKVTAAIAGNGTVVINANGTITYTPNANFNGTDTISYTISDGQGGTAMAEVTVTVVPENDVPVVVEPIPDRVRADGESFDYALAPFFSDADGHTLTYSATGLPAGLTIDATTGAIGGTIDNSASRGGVDGVYTITVTANDKNGGTVSDSFTLTITNPAPTAANDSATTAEDMPVTVAVLANDSDPDGDALTITAAVASNGTVVINSDGTLTYTPDGDFHGTDTIDYTISDGEGGVSSAELTITVTPVNDVPVVTTSPPDLTGVDGETVSIPIGGFTDPDGDPLTYSAMGLPPGLAIDPDTGVISGTIDHSASQGGPYTVAVMVKEGKGGTATSEFIFTVTNPGPSATDDMVTTAEDSPVTVPVLANDSDPDGDPLTVTSATAGNGTVTIKPDGTITYTPNGNFNGTDTITYGISDGEGGTSTAQMTVNVTPVNDGPVVTTPLPDRARADGEMFDFAAAPYFADSDGDVLTYSVAGLPVGLSIDTATGLISGTIDHSASQGGAGGIYTVTITASDGKGGSVSDSFELTVINPGPTAKNDGAMTTEDTPVTVAVLTNDSDPDGDALVVTGATAGNGAVVINADGTLTYTPNANFNGTDMITYTISDGEGGTATAQLVVTVNPDNDTPVAAEIADLIDTDGQILAGGDAVDLSSYFSDVDGNPLTFSAIGLPTGLSIDPATGIVSGTIDSSASQGGAGGVYTATITANDGNGGTASRTFEWTITNLTPSAFNDTLGVGEDSGTATVTAAGGLLANDSDADGDPLTVTEVNGTPVVPGDSVTVTGSAGGTFTVQSDGSYSFAPDASFQDLGAGETRTTTIVYVADDGNGETDTALLTVTVTGANDAPTVDAPMLPPVTRADGSSLDADPVDMSVYFSDVEGDNLTFDATGLPAGLAIDPATGVISGTIDNSASQGGTGGVYSVVISVSDGNGGSASAELSFTVVNPAPTADNDGVTTSEDEPVTIAVLSNDRDPDGDTLVIDPAFAPTAAHGIVVVNSDGTLTYTPDADFHGADTIVYRVSDGEGGFSTASVDVVVTPVNDDPVATNPTSPAQNDVDGAAVSIAMAGGFSDVDGDTLTFSAAGLPAGLTIDPATGVISGTIDPSASQGGAGGVYDVTVTVDDGNGGQASSSFDFTVTNPGPAAANDAATTDEDTAVTIAVLPNDSDPDGDALAVTTASAPNGTVVINSDGTLTYTPNADFNGIDTITYTIDEGEGGTATAQVTVTVLAANDGPVLEEPLPDATRADNDSFSYALAPHFSDADGDTLSYSAAGLPAGLAVDPETGLISGTIDHSASQGGTGGVYTVTVTATDGNGGSISDRFELTVINPAPTATGDSATTTEDSPVTIAVLANDSDPDGDMLAIDPAFAPVAAHGTVAVNPDGTLTYTPDADFHGADTIVYRLSDGEGGLSTATVNVTVTPSNDVPEPIDPVVPGQTFDPATGNYAAGTAEDTAFEGQVRATDADGDDLSYAVSGGPAHGTVSIDAATGAYVYKPVADYNGPDSFAVTISDGNGGSITSTVSLTVTAVADVAGDAIGTGENAPVTVNVLTGVGGGSADSFEDGTRAVTAVTQGTHGRVVFAADGTVTYTPDPNYNGPDSFTYTVTSGGVTETATVTVTVAAAPANSPPADGNEVVDGAPGQPLTIRVLDNASDPDGDPLTVTEATSTDGRVTINPDGTLTFLPDPGFEGRATITYIVSDGRGGTITSTVTVNVGGAGKDMNFLIGPYHNDNVITPDGPSAGRPDFIHVPLIISETVNAIRPLGSLAEISGERPLLDAVNGIRWLGGIGEFDAAEPVILQVVDRLDRMRDLRFGMDRLFDPRPGDTPERAESGSSVRQLDTGTGHVMIETVSRDHILYIEMRDIGGENDPRIIRFELQMADGAPLPEWLRMDERGLAIVESPAGAEQLHLVVRAVREDGSRVDIPIVVHSATGDVQLGGEAKEIAAARATTLGETLAVGSSADEDEQERLLAAFG